jgi:hypothetical protein
MASVGTRQVFVIDTWDLLTIHSEQPLDFLIPGLTILDLQAHDGMIFIAARATRPTSPCPSCARQSGRVQSYCARTPLDLPISGYQVRESPIS